MDRKPPASIDAPALDGDGLSLGAILGIEEAAPSGRTVHEVMADQFKAIIPPAEPGALRTLHLDDPQALVASWVRDCAGLKLGAGATWGPTYSHGRGCRPAQAEARNGFTDARLLCYRPASFCFRPADNREIRR